MTHLPDRETASPESSSRSEPDLPDTDQGHAREWPSTPYSDEARASEPAWEDAFSIALVGDCTVACRYFPPANRPEAHLAVRLRRALPDRQFLIRNLAADGESAANFLRRMDGALVDIPRLDAAFVRYGINDRKREGIPGCIANLRALCEALASRHSGIRLFIETGIWVDYPRHYLWDRNTRLAPLYEAMRTFAREAGHPVVDVFEQMRPETERGNWDLRVRGIPVPELTIVDDSFDSFFGDDPAFFTNIHPNSRCLGLIAAWEVEALESHMPTAP